MRFLQLLIVFLSMIGTTYAQAPQGIPYQAVARNSSGNILANQNIRVRFTIRDSVATGVIKYQETFTPTTNSLGLFNVNVGMGTVVSGTFSGINWGVNAKYMQVEMDAAGATSYVDMGTTQMMSVPYALHAGKATISSDSWSDYMLVVDKKPGNLTGGGFATAGWQTRSINTIIDSAGTSISANFSTNSISLTKQGKYYVSASAPGYSLYKHRIVVQDITSGVNYILGQNAYCYPHTFGFSCAKLEGFITVTSTPVTFVIKHFVNSGFVSDHENLGVAVQDGLNEQVYTEIFVKKVR